MPSLQYGYKLSHEQMITSCNRI